MDAPLRRRLVLAAAAAGARLPAWAQSSAPASATATATARPPRRLRLVALGVAPFGMVAADGSASGLFVELARMLAEQSQLAIDSVVVPYPRALAMISSGEADLLISIANSRLESVVRPLASVFKGDIVAVGRAGTRINSLADLRGKVVGHIRGAEYVAAFSADAAIRKHETSTIEQTVRMLLEGRYDAAIGFRDSMLYALRELGQPREKLGPMLELGQREVFLFMSQRSSHQDAAPALARAVDALREKGGIKALRERYFGGLSRN
jgi:ABC-type amino acid transport substrate-binding protein